jgi:putative ABC transport system substrate-binding protein
VAGFRKGLSEAGYVEGRNVVIEYRWAQNELERLRELADDLVRRRVAVIATGTTNATLAAKAATTISPIVFHATVDLIQAGLVASLNRPGGTITGVNSMSGELGAKRLGLLHELVPGAERFAYLSSTTSPAKEAAFANGRNVWIDARWGRGDYNRIGGLAQELVASVDVSYYP